MNTSATTSVRRTKKPYSFYRLRFLFILWAVFLSVFYSYLTPPQIGEAYISVEPDVLGATVEDREVEEWEYPIFYPEEERISATITPSSAPTPTGQQSSEAQDHDKYSRSRQIGEYTWTIDVPEDDRAGTADEIFQALNSYRQKNGKTSLQLSEKLSEYASSRAQLFADKEKTDSHEGFLDFINSQDGFTKLGFMKIGENSSYGYKVSGTKLIEDVYAGDRPHDMNQLHSDWTHVGIGVSGMATNLIFAGKPL